VAGRRARARREGRDDRRLEPRRRGLHEAPQQAFAAATCLRNTTNQKRNAIKGGLPPVTGSLYDDPSLAKPYPFQPADQGRAAVRERPAADAALLGRLLAIQKALSPPGSANPSTVVKTLRSQIKQALGGSALL